MRLVVIAGPDKGAVFTVEAGSGQLLGRGRDVSIRLNDPRVSRVHCELEIGAADGRLHVTDLGSNGGTASKGRRAEEHVLGINDSFQVGDSELRLEGDVADAATLPPRKSPRAPALTAGRLHELSGKRLSHFDIGPKIAQGSTGMLFRARDFRANRSVAFKVMFPEFTMNEEDIRRFIRAMKTILPLRHPNLVTLYGAGKTGAYCWISMEYVEAENLAAVIDRLGTAGMVDWRRTLRLCYYIGRALEYAHGRSVIHRNITPTNILVGNDPAATKLADLMLAKALEGNLAEQITKSGQVLGDVRYMSPERAAGGTAATDARSDLYSLGALTYTLLAGRPPFEGANLIETLARIARDTPVSPKKYQLAIPDLFEGVVMRMIAKRPQERFQNATSLLKDLKRVALYSGIKL